MNMNRRQFLRAGSAGLAASSLVALGFSPAAALAETRQYKLTHATETRNNCTYCSVGCGLLMYSLGDGARNTLGKVIHIEGDPDHPVSRGSLCPKGAGLLDFVHAPTRLRQPAVREAGSKEWKPITWDEALDRIVKLMKDDRDANFQTQNKAGQIVNRWLSTGVLAASASSNEAGYITHKVMRSLGILVFDNQARV
jgi:formate dehydrogenase major subunit